ncbi:MAG: LPS-assembly protein LptD [Treponema sp.]|jgi:lipopolysaccharide assembly outer membrane protein LptD (OstA)|nr:LPS-assembly protein LptD [Treponema sp.]
MKKICLLLILLAMLVFSPIYGQETELADADTPAINTEIEEGVDTEPVKETVEEMDIRTSTLQELANWCRSLGLSEGGAKEELANRLRDYYQISAPNRNEEPSTRVITIESAQSTEYFSLDVVDEDYARLKGGVIVSVKDGDAIHRITAGEILYNRTRNLISASNGVSYEKIEGGSTETFRGDSITVNLDNWSSVFVNGQSEKAVESSGVSYRFEGTVISLDTEKSTVLTKSRVTNAKTEEPYWSLNASKMWLLSGSDWAVANAVLKVGEIPVLYLPFFYLPSEEILFHPVIGTRSREGNFFQTTTYLMGEPKSAVTTTESSFTSMFGDSANMEKERRGLFLRSTGKKKATSAEQTRLSLLFDAYSNLGAYVGTEFSMPRKGILGALTVSTGLGYTRNIYSSGTSYSPFQNGKDEWNTENWFFFTEIPFRYRFRTTGSLSGRYGSLNWTIPFYSDPYVESDFMNRSEALDWSKILKGAAAQEEDKTTTTSSISSYSWTLSASVNPKLPTSFSPYLSTLSLSSLSSTLAFNRKTLSGVNSASPNREFFYPEKWTMFSVSTSIAGTPLTLGGTSTSTTTTPTTEEKDYLEGIGTPRSPWGEAETAPETASLPSETLVPPILTQKFTMPVMGNHRFVIDYRWTPTAASETQFDKALWTKSEDIDWTEQTSTLSTVHGDGSVGFALSQSQGFYSANMRLSETSAWQDYTYMNEEATEFDTDAERDTARFRAYQQTRFSSTYESSLTVKPFYLSPTWGNTSLQYSLRGLLYKDEYDSKSTAADPARKITWGDYWDETNTTSQFSANLNASIFDKTQSITFTGDLPPKDASISANGSFNIWLFSATLRGKVYDPFGLQESRKIDTLTNQERTFDPIYFTGNFSFPAPANTFLGGEKGATYSAQQYAVFDPELDEWTNLTSTIAMGNFRTVFTMTRSKGYNLVAGTGWVQSTDKEQLIPNMLTASYNRSISKDGLWKNRLSFSVNASSNLSLDLQRYTYSKFTFSLRFTVNIADFVELSFSTNSENNAIYRYLQDMPMFDTGIEIAGEKNVLIDLLNSFDFGDETKRKSSGFKLKSFSLSAVHHLGDWDATLSVTMSPYLDNKSRPPVYKFNNQISFLVQWKPIAEIKTEMTYDESKTDNKWIFK